MRFDRAGLPQAWRRWCKQHQLEERAAAYDAVRVNEIRARQQAAREEELERRVERCLQIDKLVYQEMIDLHAHFRRLLALPSLDRVEERTLKLDPNTGEQKRVTKTLDPGALIAKITTVTEALEARYFACLAVPAEQAQEKADTPLVAAEFTWKPDPEMEAAVERARQVAEQLSAAMNARNSTGKQPD